MRPEYCVHSIPEVDYCLRQCRGIGFMMISITDNCCTQNHTAAACKLELDMDHWLPEAKGCPEHAFN